MSEEKPKSGNNVVILAGALVLGAVVGSAVASRGGDETKALNARIEALEASLAEELELKAAAMTKSVDYVNDRIDELETSMETDDGDDEIAEDVDAVADRVTVMARQMAALIGRIAAMEAAPAAPAAAPAAAATPAADEAANDDAADEGAPAEAAAADEEPAAESAAALAAALGEDGVAISVGQTARFGDAVFFLSRLDADAGAARLLAMGAGPVLVGGDAGAYDMGDGCALTLLGIAEGKAFLKPACE